MSNVAPDLCIYGRFYDPVEKKCCPLGRAIQENGLNIEVFLKKHKNPVAATIDYFHLNKDETYEFMAAWDFLNEHSQLSKQQIFDIALTAAENTVKKAEEKRLKNMELWSKTTNDKPDFRKLVNLPLQLWNKSFKTEFVNGKWVLFTDYQV